MTEKNTNRNIEKRLKVFPSDTLAIVSAMTSLVKKVMKKIYKNPFEETLQHLVLFVYKDLLVFNNSMRKFCLNLLFIISAFYCICDIINIGVNMKVISIREPFATLIKDGIKTVETRSWKTNYRDKIYIHSCVKKDKIRESTKPLIKSELKYGYILCSADLVDCVYMDEKNI